VRFAADGAGVGIADILDDEAARQEVALIEAQGREDALYVSDVTNTAQSGRLFDRFLVEHGRVDIVVTMSSCRINRPASSR